MTSQDTQFKKGHGRLRPLKPAICRVCNIALTKENVIPSRWKNDRPVELICNDDYKKYNNQRLHNHPYYKTEERKTNQFMQNILLKVEVMVHYLGGSFRFTGEKCNCGDRIFEMSLHPYCPKCSIMDLRCLTMDKIDGGHTKDVREGRIKGNLYRWLKKQGYPEGWQVMCMNCQWIKRTVNRECSK